METIVFGLNHKTAPIEIREQLFLNPLQQDLFLSDLKTNPEISDALVLSTCNRTEIYLRALNGRKCVEPIVRQIFQLKKINFTSEILSHFYCLESTEALRHFMKVAAGLDSLVLGEKQIIGQVKLAVERSRERHMLSRYFNIFSNLAIRAAKKAQSETDISFGGSSVSWAAMVKAEEELGTLNQKSILIIGAGKMGALTIDQLRDKGPKNIYLMNRTGSAAQALAQTCNGIPVSFEDIKEVLTEVDICICAADAPHYILDQKMIEKIMRLRNQRDLLLIDISMPRNIDPAVASVPAATLLCIDDLDQVVSENLRKREAAVYDVNRIIEEKLAHFEQKLTKLHELEVGIDG